MTKLINSNCKRCPDFTKERCDGNVNECMCKYCPRNLGVCINVRWCRETESQILFED